MRGRGGYGGGYNQGYGGYNQGYRYGNQGYQQNQYYGNGYNQGNWSFLLLLHTLGWLKIVMLVINAFKFNISYNSWIDATNGVH